MSIEAIGELLRCSMGLSAWKQYGNSRWALRVNPSSGNLHPTEAYVVWDRRVCHYAPAEHALELRAELRPSSPSPLPPDTGLLVGLTSIHWREAWKYGERAYRYCQHDAGHAIGALRIAASLLGWRLTLLPQWRDQALATLLGLDRDGDYAGAEREHPDCLALVTAGAAADAVAADPASLVAAARGAAWQGRANRLSASHVEWPIIDEVTVATRDAGLTRPAPHAAEPAPSVYDGGPGVARGTGLGGAGLGRAGLVSPAPLYPRELLLQRRSATAFETRYALPAETFLSMLARLQPDRAPWDALYWPAHVHLALFVHRVDGLTPGVYAYLRDPAVRDEWRAAMRGEFLWEPHADGVPLYLLVPIDARDMARRLSCDQDIAGDGCFSLGMIARVEGALRERGASFYRRLFWESGLIGQVLYLEAEANGVRATGIGCYYDDPVHQLLGLQGHAWQSLYHLAVGMPVDDARLTTEAGYAWEAGSINRES